MCIQYYLLKIIKPKNAENLDLLFLDLPGYAATCVGGTSLFSVYFQGIMHSPDMLQETGQLFTWPKSARTFESNCRKAWLGSISEHHHHQNTLWCCKPCNVFQRHTLCLDTRWGPTNVVPIINYPRTKQLLTKPGVYVTGGQQLVQRETKWRADFLPPEPPPVQTIAMAEQEIAHPILILILSWWIRERIKENTSWGIVWLSETNEQN